MHVDRSKLCAFAIVALGLSGCGTSISETPLNSPPGPMTPRDPSKVEVFTTPPSQPFIEVAMLEAQQQSNYSTDGSTQIVAKLRAYAANRGCDAIIINGSNNAVVGDVAGGSGDITTLKGYRATCIVYKPATASPSSSSSAKTNGN